MKILMGTDGSDDALEAARRALALLGRALGGTDTITLVCAVEPPAIEGAGMEAGMTGGVASPEEIDAAWGSVKAEATSALERTAAVVSDAVSAGTTAPSIEHVIEEGSAGPAICRAAAERAADVVVVGSRGRGAIRRALLGSVSTHVVNHAPCPVLVIRAGVDG